MSQLPVEREMEPGRGRALGTPASPVPDGSFSLSLASRWDLGEAVRKDQLVANCSPHKERKKAQGWVLSLLNPRLMLQMR